jgi:hypothetical protein
MYCSWTADVRATRARGRRSPQEREGGLGDRLSLTARSAGLVETVPGARSSSGRWRDRRWPRCRSEGAARARACRSNLPSRRLLDRSTPPRTHALGRLCARPSKRSSSMEPPREELKCSKFSHLPGPGPPVKIPSPPLQCHLRVDRSEAPAVPAGFTCGGNKFLLTIDLLVRRRKTKRIGGRQAKGRTARRRSGCSSICRGGGWRSSRSPVAGLCRPVPGGGVVRVRERGRPGEDLRTSWRRGWPS